MRQEATAVPSDNKPGIWDEISGKCNGKRLGGNGLCRQPEAWGVIGVSTGRCKRHGGSTKNHRKAAAKKAAIKAVETFGLPRDVDAPDALVEEVHRTAGILRYLDSELRGLTEDELKEKGFLLGMYGQERRHGVDVNKATIGAGIAERRIRLDEQLGVLIAQVINGVLEDLGVADRPDVPAIVRRHLVAVDGGKAA